MPGLLQVREYAYDMFTHAGYGEAEATAKAEDRLKRQSILGGPDPVHVSAVIHESVLYRRVGSPATMVTQLEHLLVASQLPNVIIQVVRGDEYFPGMEGEFQVATGDSIPDTLVMVVAMEDQNSQDKAMVRTATKLFREIQSRALNTEDTRTLIREALQRWQPADSEPRLAQVQLQRQRRHSVRRGRGAPVAQVQLQRQRRHAAASRPATFPARSSSATPRTTAPARCCA